MAAPPQIYKGIVKQVLSGDAVIIRGQPKGGPPPERTVCLSNIQAPRLARRANPNIDGSLETKDEPFAWEAREFLRKKLIGKEVAFTVEYKTPGTGREYGCIFLGKDNKGENITEAVVSQGLVEVRRQGIRANDESQQQLIALEEQAKAQQLGRWATGTGSENVRDIIWSIDNPRHFVDSHHSKPVQAIVEFVRDACTVRAFILPSFHHVTIMMSGIKGPMFKMDGEPDAFADEAKYFTESRLLQKDVEIILEGVSNANILGTIIHPNGSIAELLLKEGFARCVDWSMGVVSQGADKLRAAEKVAKGKQLKIWKDFKASESKGAKGGEKAYTAKVVEVVNGDAICVKLADGSVKKLFLSSIRPPRLSSDQEESKKEKEKDQKYRFRPLYDIPYMFEAREFLRKKLIGKKVNIKVDYIQPPNPPFPEKTCCTVTISNINVADTLISRGYASVIRYRQDDDQRSAHYDELLAAENRAQKKAVGLHSKKEPPAHKVADISGDVAKSKAFLPFLQRAGRMEGLVEFVASGSRLRLYIPRETCLITFLLSGIDCPRGARQIGGESIPAGPYGNEALLYTKEIILQREVQVEVEAMDKGGNFIGYMHADGLNLSVALVEEGLAKVHFTAERGNYYNVLSAAEEKAKNAKKNVWKNYEEPKDEEVTVASEPEERSVDYKTVVVTELGDDLHFFAQSVDQGPQLEKLMEQLRSDMASNPPLPGSYTPKRYDMCAAQYSDDEWYRAKIERINKDNTLNLLYIDYGNRETTTMSRTAVLPAVFHTMPAQAKEYSLACIALPTDEDARADAEEKFYQDTLNKELQLNVEYRPTNVDAVTLLYKDSREDVGLSLVSEGLVTVEKRKEKRLAKIVGDYSRAQDKAKKAHLNLWRYGDFTEDECKEFGYKN